jgi:[ribosomal protein S18]-alanine N-acetyltransferase
MPDLTSAKIRDAVAADIPGIIDLERRCPLAAHWTTAQYRELFQHELSRHESSDPERLILIAETSAMPPPPLRDATSALAGFLVAVHIASEWELENIAVDPTAQRQGIGRQLLDSLFGMAKETKSEAVFLEVRESNIAARALYEKAGFTQTGRRKAYYQDTQEDAILYRRNLGF